MTISGTNVGFSVLGLRSMSMLFQKKKLCHGSSAVLSTDFHKTSHEC